MTTLTFPRNTEKRSDTMSVHFFNDEKTNPKNHRRLKSKPSGCNTATRADLSEAGRLNNQANLFRFGETVSYISNDINDLPTCQNQSFGLADTESKKNDNCKVWQNDFHPIAIYSEEFYKQKLNYIHQNPVRKGCVTEPGHWFYSSARNYAGTRYIR